MKRFKKVNKLMYILIAFLVLSVQIVIPDSSVKAKTLRDLKDELAAKRSEYDENQSNKALTEQEMQEVYATIGQITAEKDDIEKEIVDLNNEIVELNEQIVVKNEQIKNVIKYYQISSSGESAYLEYLFKSTSFSDFIYRMAVAEQLSSYNNNLITEYNNLIEQNENKKRELNEKTIELNAKQSELEEKLVELNANLSDIMDATVDIEDEIAMLEEYIEMYENKYGCEDDDDLDECKRGKLPPSTKFFRPVEYGVVSADYGWYYPWGYAMWHYGMDITGNYLAPVYATTDGLVAAIYYHQSCGGNMVYIQHYVNGQSYTSSYYHLSSVTVNVGDIVTSQTQIGTVGGSRNEWWDSCSTGAHLHFQLSYGLYMQDYTSYNTFCANAFDPRNLVNIPPEGVWFSNRTSMY